MRAALVLLCVALGAVAAVETEGKIDEKFPHHGLVGIKGGTIIPIHKRPYVVALVHNRTGYCGNGVLINKEWVLTVASNVVDLDQSRVKVRIESDDANNGGILIQVSEIIVHENYRVNWDHDIALVKLKTPVQINPKAKPVDLASSLPKADAECVVAGYGGTEYELESDGFLREATVPFITNKVCAEKYEGEDVNFTSEHFCASKPGVGPCPLDWGDPLVYKNKLIGIFVGSFSDCGSNLHPGVFIDVTQYAEWIRKHQSTSTNTLH